MNDPTIIRPIAPIGIQDLVSQAERGAQILAQVRGLMLAPSARKVAPTFSSSALAALCAIDKAQLNYRVGKGDLPCGQVKGSGSRRTFTLEEARAWITEYRRPPRPAGQMGLTIAIGNFKGGVGKTTTAMTLAQGLSLRNYKCLLIDVDPQGSLTTLFGVLPDTEIDERDTISPLCHGDEKSIRYAIRPSYWAGIDFVPAASVLFGAEFALPARQVRDPSFEFWAVLDEALDDVRAEYDVIIIDTPPALSYLTINAFMAADGLILPSPPSALDFSSSVQFWSLFSDLASGLQKTAKLDKRFEFIHVLLARVDMSDAASSVVRQWIAATYGEKLLPVEVPKTAVAAASAAEFGTVYDVTHYEGNAKTFQRAHEAYERVTEIMDQTLRQCWNARKQLTHSPGRG